MPGLVDAATLAGRDALVAAEDVALVTNAALYAGQAGAPIPGRILHASGRTGWATGRVGAARRTGQG